MSWIRSGKSVMILMAVSALLGIEILVEEAVIGPDGGRYLWYFATVAAPISHAYGLIGFVVIDLAVLAAIRARHVRGVQLALAWSILMTLTLVLNPLTGPMFTPDFTPIDFAQYLFGIWAYDALLIVRVVTVPVAWMSLKALKTANVTL